jgi:hypothetical protein
MRVGRHIHAAGSGHLNRTEMVGGTPCSDEYSGTLGQRSQDRHGTNLGRSRSPLPSRPHRGVRATYPTGHSLLNDEIFLDTVILAKLLEPGRR